MLRPWTLLLLAACSGGDPTDSAGPATDGADGTAADGADGGDGVDGSDGTAGEASWTFGPDTVTVAVTDLEDGRRSYALTTTHPQRDGAPSSRTVAEAPGDPLLRSGVLLTDALFALAVDDARLNAVSQISDGAFASPVDCDCYQTGALWSWVWTRDIAYAVELGLAWLDPDRAANSLLFKLSRPKAGGSLQIVQDTGTGGSWPVSTDRVAWARGAMAVLRYTDHPALRAAATEALRETARVDRRYAFDPTDGLYRGETSFLDWREQTYPGWVADNVVHVAMSKSLSTNLDHLFLLRSLEALTGEEHGAAALAAAIDAAFWDGAVYRSAKTTTLDPHAPPRQDLLATSLAILDLGTHPEALEGYPLGEHGPAVIWPQQQRTPIYHNRGIWPFVTAYSVLAARAADNGAWVSAGLDSLVRGAALNLSHMENLELATGANHLEEGETSGPVVNSQRQLWSVAGFLGAVVHGVFGMQGADGAVSFDPKLPDGPWFAPGATLTVGPHTATLGSTGFGPGAATAYDASDWTQVFGAQTPSLALTGDGDAVTLTFSSDEDATYTVLRDGVVADEDATSPWRDTAPHTACYSVYATLQHAGQPTEPQCWWGDGAVRVQSVTADAFAAVGGFWSTEHGRGHHSTWGAPGHSLTLSVTPRFSGEHLLQAVYGNGAGGTDTGITAAVKWLTVTDRTGTPVAEGPLVMPHRTTWDNWGDSSFVPATLTAGEPYTVTITDGFNMSYLDHYTDYVAGRGGGPGPSNDVNIAEIKLLFLR